MFWSEELIVQWQAMATILFSRACGKISVVFPAAIQFCSWVCMEIVAGQTQATLSPMIFPGEM